MKFQTLTFVMPILCFSGTQLFERQDLKRELTEDDEKDFAFIPDAIITKKEVIRVDVEDDENNELLK